MLSPDQRQEILARKPKDVTKAQVKALLEHYYEKPFDKIRDGVLKVRNKHGQVVAFRPWPHQLRKLEWFETCWDANEPGRAIELKARQIGSSTFSMAMTYAVASTRGGYSAHLVAHKKFACARLMKMFKFSHRHDFEPIRPKAPTRNVGQIVFSDLELGIDESELLIESAELREDIARSGTFQLSNFSELAYWPEQAETFAALKPTIPKEGRIIQFEESTGQMINDLFFTRYHKAKEGAMPGWKAFFVPWFDHPEYRSPLRGKSEAEFWAGCKDADLQLAQAYGLDAEQMNWYIHEREDWLSGPEGGTEELFRREYPSNEQEAFSGGGQTFFDIATVKADQLRVSRPIMVSLADLDDSTTLKSRVSLGTQPKTRYCRCQISVTYGQNMTVTGGRLIESKSGDLQVWERPRPQHLYVVAVDPAEGKLAIKNVRQSGDWSLVGVWRYTYEPTEAAMIAQVAQMRTQKYDPRELARYAVALSKIYANPFEQMDACIIIERNNHGLTTIEEAKDSMARFYFRQVFGKYNDVVMEEQGFLSSGGGKQSSKIIVLTAARAAYQNGLLRLNSYFTTEEMSYFCRHNDGSYGAVAGKHDDTVTEMYLACECVRYLVGAVAPVPVKEYDLTKPRDSFAKIGPLPPTLQKPQFGTRKSRFKELC